MKLRQRIAAKLKGTAWSATEVLSLETWRRVRPSFDIPPAPVSSLLLGPAAHPPNQSYYRSTWPDGVSLLTSHADSICDHQLKMLGGRRTLVSAVGVGYQPIRWHTDPTSGHQWGARRLSSFIRPRTPEGTDLLRVWVLSRMQHLVVLGQAYFVSRDPKYADEYKSEVTDWISANPLGHGVNWMTSMDVALRAVSWLLALELFADCDRVGGDRVFLRRLYRALQEHGKFILLRAKLKLATGRQGTNHHVVAMTGLLFIAAYCPFLPESEEWRAFAVAELRRAAQDQVLADGWDYEASTSYHRLVLECFFYSLVICERAGIRGSDILAATTRKMFEAVLHGAKGNGHVPQIGDNDGSRLLLLHPRRVLDHGYLLGLAAAWYSDPEFKVHGIEADEEVFWAFGNQGLQSIARLPDRQRPRPSTSFDHAGWHVLRKGEVYCFVSCGPNGQGGSGGHAHNDKLSFELRLGDVDLVVDPGSMVYGGSPRLRNEYRSTGFHNTFSAHDCEQNRIPSDLFFLEDRVQIITSKLNCEQTRVVYRGAIRYGDIVHQRSISVQHDPPVISIEDVIEQASRSGGVISLHLGPSITHRDGALVAVKTGRRIATLEIQGGEVRVERYQYSPEYDVGVEARRVVIQLSAGAEEARVETVIRGC